MEANEVKRLLFKYQNGTASEEEKALLESWYLLFEPAGEESLQIEEMPDITNQVWDVKRQSSRHYPKKRQTPKPLPGMGRNFLFIDLLSDFSNSLFFRLCNCPVCLSRNPLRQRTF